MNEKLKINIFFKRISFKQVLWCFGFMWSLGACQNFTTLPPLLNNHVQTIAHFETRIGNFIVEPNRDIIATDFARQDKLLRINASQQISEEASGAGNVPSNSTIAESLGNPGSEELRKFLGNTLRYLLPHWLARSSDEKTRLNSFFILDPVHLQIRISEKPSPIQVFNGLGPELVLNGYVELRPHPLFKKTIFNPESLLTGLAIDKENNRFTLDLTQNQVLKIDSQGNVNVLAGSGKAGFKDGKGSEAEFKRPLSLCLDKNNHLWIADTLNHAIRKISPDGTVTSISQPDKKLNVPTDLAFYKNSLLVVDSHNHRIMKYSPESESWSIFAGTGKAASVDGTFETASFNSPVSLYVEGEQIYVGENLKGTIRQLKHGHL